jgi:predicted transcriptional regulator
MNSSRCGQDRFDTTAPERSSTATLEELPERIRDIATLRGLGYSFRQIGGQFGVTPQAVSVMLSRYLRCLRTLKGSGELRNLSPRAVNALARHGIRTREQARQKNAIALMKGSRNCGTKTLAEIADWMQEGALQCGVEDAA